MRNREQQIRELRTEVDSLSRRIQMLSARVELLEKGEPLPAENPVIQPIPAPAEPEKKFHNLESNVGKNLFAVLASLLMLLGVAVFISTIYERIPDVVKIIAIFAFGFALLGVGLGLYRKNKNNFWLGVASCGMAELLVSIITSHSYFGVLPLPGAFALILVWILGALGLTKIQSVVFKTIGYLGFAVSMALGLNLLGADNLGMYLTLVGAFGVLGIFFLLTNREQTVLNTALAFGNVLNLFQFVYHSSVLRGEFLWIRAAVAIVLLAAFHVVYLRYAKLHRNAYPYFAILSAWMLWMYLLIFDAECVIPLMLVVLLGLWYLSQRVADSKKSRCWYTCLACILLWILSRDIRPVQWPLMFWYPALTLGAYGLYWLTGCNTAGWLGLASFGIFYFLGMDNYTTPDWMFWMLFGGGAAFFGLHCRNLPQRDEKLRTAWYALIFNAAHTLLFRWQMDHAGHQDLLETVGAVFGFTLAVANTAYLHLSTADRKKVMRITAPAIVPMVLQVYLIAHVMEIIGSDTWYVAVLGIAGSLIPVSHSLWYTYRIKGGNRYLMIWQFIKFTLYIWAVLWLLDSPSILVNIALLLLAIGAIVAGFKLGHKSVRVYGLVLSLLDVVSLVLFNIDYSDSLQLAGGIILCGVLCFVISFIYSKLSKLTLWEAA